MNKKNHRILLISSDPLLQATLKIGLSSLDEIELIIANDVDEFYVQFEDEHPSLVISDFYLPTRSPLEIFNKISISNYIIPIILLVPYLSTHHASLTHNRFVDILEKPVEIDFFRNLIMSRINASIMSAVKAKRFHPSELLQISAFSRHSHLISVYKEYQLFGEIIIHHGIVWSSKDTEGYGFDSFKRIMSLNGDIMCVSNTLDVIPPNRNLCYSWNRLLSESLAIRNSNNASSLYIDSNSHKILEPIKGVDRDHDYFGENDTIPSKGVDLISINQETCCLSHRNYEYEFISDEKLSDNKTASSSNLNEKEQFDHDRQLISRQLPISSKPKRFDPDDTDLKFDRVFEEGVDALLNKNYEKALMYFLEARKLKPTHGRVLANLNRLAELGFSFDS
ncbi:response regulator [Myxococcota bacterium]|nr:response regulator [Myxococcota bacterium]MBU1899282.1 response regulator [Myxococcota bacterium]